MWPLRGVGVRAEHDRLGADLRGEGLQPLGRRAIGHRVAAGERAGEQRGAAVEHFLGLLVADGLVGVADVAEGHLGAGTGEQRAEGDRVVLVGGSVVGDDDLGGHGRLLLSSYVRVLASRGALASAKF